MFEMGTGVTLPPSPPGKLLQSLDCLSVAPASAALGRDRRLIFIKLLFFDIRWTRAESAVKSDTESENNISGALN